MKKIVFLWLLTVYCIQAQDLSGRWVAMTGYGSGYYAELYLVQNNDNVYAGHAYDTENGGFCRHWFDAKFDPSTGKFLGLDVELINKSENHAATDYILQYKKGEDGKEYLIGTSAILPYAMRPRGVIAPTMQNLLGLRFNNFAGVNRVQYVKVSDSYKIYDDTMPLAMTEEQILLEKAAFPEVFEEPSLTELQETEELTNESEQEESNLNEGENEEDLVEIPSTPNEEQSQVEPSEIPGYTASKKIEEDKTTDITEKKEKRTNQVFSHLRLKTDRVTLLIKDYGTIDNDTVTIFYNDKIIAKNLRLTEKAAEFDLQLEPDQRNTLTFVANNLGDVPPNTARITIIADNKRYNYKLFSDDKTNAVVLLENIISEPLE